MTISEKVMRGQYVSKAECFEHAEEIDRTLSCYGQAMDAYDKWELEMEACTCDHDGDPECGYRRYRTAKPCPVREHAEEDAEADAEAAE